MADYAIAAAIEKIAVAIKAYADAKVTAAKIAANSDQRVAGNNPMFRDRAYGGDR